MISYKQHQHDDKTDTTPALGSSTPEPRPIPLVRDEVERAPGSSPGRWSDKKTNENFER